MIVAKHHVWDKMADVDQPLVSTAKKQVTIVCPRSAHPPRIVGVYPDVVTCSQLTGVSTVLILSLPKELCA